MTRFAQAQILSIAMSVALVALTWIQTFSPVAA